MMRIFIKLLKNKNLVIVAGLILIIVVIFVYGARLRLSFESRLLAVVILLFFGIIYLQIKQIQAKRGAAKLEESIQAQADEQKLSMRPEKREEIDALKQELTIAIESLKRSKLGKGRSGKAALYALPWYMFIGPPAAGKTTAIKNSGLEFPSGSDIKGVGGTRNCDWFFSNSAILLDTAGRYTTEDEDRQEWHAFLDILKKYRSRQPINGVIVGMSIADLLKATTEEIEWHARNIRKRIDELVKRLDTRFPVYLVFTKCDLLQGFVELFENLSRKEREQIWGCTLSREQQSKMNPREVFEKEFQVLVQSLNEYRLKCFSSAVKPENRGRVFVFPLEFNSIREKMGHFINKLFQPNPYQESPFFRGFYFTSGTQEGIPIDRVIEAVSKQFGLPPEMMSEPEVEKKSYFIKRLFTDIIIPDRNMVVQTSSAASRKSFVRIGAVAASAIVLGAFILGISQAFVRSRFNLRTVKSVATSTQKVQWSQSVSLVNNFKYMENLRTQLEKLEHSKAHPPLIRSGMYRGNSLLTPTRKLYYQKLNSFVDMSLYRVLESRLSDYKNGVPYPWETIMNHLGAYLLMGSQVSRLEDSENEDFLRRELSEILKEALNTFSQQELDEIKPLVENQIDFYVKSLNKEGSLQFKNEMNLVEEVRTWMLTYGRPSFEGIYTRIKNMAEDRNLGSLTLPQVVSEQYGNLITCDNQVPGIFTKIGWEQFVNEAIKAESKNPAKRAWILGDQGKTLTPEMQDERMIEENLLILYWREYAQSWRQFLQSIQYRPEDNLAAMARNLNQLGHPSDSPLIPLLNRVMAETKFIQQLEKSTGLDQKLLKPFKKDKETAPEEENIHDIDRQFRALHSLVSVSESGEPGDLGNILLQYTTISAALESIKSDPSKATEYAATLLQQDAGELPTAMKTIRMALKEVDADTKQKLFEQPVIKAWEVILGEAQIQLNSLWRSKVYDLFQSSLANSYPFNSSGDDAPMKDVEEFFKAPDGTLWAFVETHLKPFVRPETWRPNTWEGQGIRLSPSIIDAFRKADDINKGLFGKGGFPVYFMLQPDIPEKISGNLPYIRQVCISIDGKEECYQMGGPRDTEFTWPKSGSAAGAKLRVQMNNRNSEPDAKDHLGEWGWIRLLEEAEIVPEDSTYTKFRLSWDFVREGYYQVRIKYRLTTRTAMNPFRNLKSFFKFQCPSQLN